MHVRSGSSNIFIEKLLTSTMLKPMRRVKIRDTKMQDSIACIENAGNAAMENQNEHLTVLAV